MVILLSRFQKYRSADMQIYLKARAKINVSLDVLGKREDGYHEVKMIMQTLELHDGIYIKKIDKPRVKLVTSLTWLPTDQKNLAFQAAELLRQEYKIKEGIFINIKKNIPVSAGLAGGSTDCAATLIGVKNLFKLPISRKELTQMGQHLGADVPFCMMRGTALAEGIGEKLTRLNPHPRVYILLAKPSISISTASVFKKFNADSVTKHPNTEKIIEHINARNQKGIAEEFCNVLESVTIEQHPIITQLKATMMANKSLGALMTGSGPTVFGYFRSKGDAYKAMDQIKILYPSIKELFVTKVYNVVK